MKPRKKSWINTASGTQVYPLKPTPESLLLEDVWWALPNMCRYSGHCRFYSIGEHSVNVARGVQALGGSLIEIRDALLHDGSETWLVDIPSPIKYHGSFGSEYQKAERRLNRVFREKMGLPKKEAEIVKYVDKQMIGIEAPRIFKKIHPDWAHVPVNPTLEYLFQGKRFGLTPGQARTTFGRWLKKYFPGENL